MHWYFNPGNCLNSPFIAESSSIIQEQETCNSPGSFRSNGIRAAKDSVLFLLSSCCCSQLVCFSFFFFHSLYLSDQIKNGTQWLLCVKMTQKLDCELSVRWQVVSGSEGHEHDSGNYWQKKNHCTFKSWKKWNKTIVGQYAYASHEADVGRVEDSSVKGACFNILKRTAS